MSSDTSNVEIAGIKLQEQGTDSSQYKLSDEQKKMFRNLARKMGFVSLCILVIGVPICIIGVIKCMIIYKSNENPNLVGQPNLVDQQINAAIYSIQMFVLYLIYLWTSKAASAFKMIEDSRVQDNDLDKLMNALRKMRNLYRVQRNIVNFTLIGITIVYGIICLFYILKVR
ncbi:MAG TPA: hypothetical protein V6D11_30345 [Waterburya sp.]